MLFLIPSLVPPKGRARLPGNKHWKPSTTECRDSLMLLVDSASDIETAKNVRVDQMFKCGHTVQPYILLIGSLTNVTAAYVIVNNYTYKTLSVLDAIEFCFKIFHVLDLKYPFQSEHIWLLLQRLLFGIQTNKDKKIPFIEDLLS